MDELTRMLACRMAAIVPTGFHVEAADGMLWYSAEEGRFPGQSGNYQVGRSGTCVRVNFEGSGQAAEGALAGVAAMALGELQDYVDEATHDPWPARRGTPPRPYAQVHEQMLYLWYGGPDLSKAAVLACEPIPVADLRPD
jgi:hypothetical protein